MQPCLILFRGVPGAGKTTLAEHLSLLSSVELSGNSYKRIQIIAADDYFIDCDTGEYNFNPGQIKNAHAYCFEFTKQVLNRRDKSSVIVHNTFTEEWQIQPYRRLADELGIPFYSVVVENRHGNNSVHNVPSSVRSRMAGQLKHSIKVI